MIKREKFEDIEKNELSYQKELKRTERLKKEKTKINEDIMKIKNKNFKTINNDIEFGY